MNHAECRYCSKLRTEHPTDFISKDSGICMPCKVARAKEARARHYARTAEYTRHKRMEMREYRNMRLANPVTPPAKAVQR